MKDSAYLVLNARGIIDLTKRRPNLKSGQHAVKLSVSVDDKYFEQAIPTAVLTITEDHLIAPQIDVALSEPVV